MTAKQTWVLGCTSLASVMVALDALVVSTALSEIRLHDRSETRASTSDRVGRNSESLMHQMAQARQADLLREAEKYRSAGPTPRPTVLSRVTARIPRFPIGSRRRRPRGVVPSTPGRMPLLKINFLKATRLRRTRRSP